MKNVSMITISALAALALSVTGCGEDTTPTAAVANCDSSVIDEVLSSSITSDKTLTFGTTYGLDGKVVVESGATLTIEPGVTVAGCTASSFMLIAAGSQIDANGTLALPITFTSETDVLGNSSAGSKGEWGGLAILGNATIHGGTKTYEASTESFGGSSDGESSGTLNYVVIKHSGYEVETDKELNGLSLAGVGTGTSISNIAIIGGADDGIEFWGGSVDVDGLYVYNASDDSVDTDLGYNGTINNVYVQQLSGSVDKSDYNSAGFEFGNDSNTYVVDDLNATYPTITNATVNVVAGGMYLKNDAGANLSNVLMTKTESVDSANTTLYSVITHRTDDVSDTNATTLAGSFTVVNDTNATNLFATANKDSASTTIPASSHWADAAYVTQANLNPGTAATGAGTVWKGNAGDNNHPAGE